MGEALDPTTVGAFTDEVTKIAGIGLAARAGRFIQKSAPNVVELGRRIISPVKGMGKGWAHLSPTGRLGAGGEQAAKYLKRIEQAGTGNILRRSFGPGAHLNPAYVTPESAGRTRQLAERLSRAGWTGAGRFTKYVPLGDKATMLGVAPAFAAHGLSTGATGPGEEVGATLGWTIPGILAAGTGIPGAAATIAAGYYGGQLGRRFDEPRTSTAPQQIAAPANEEAGRLA